jgi:hypothetical protein
LGGAAPGLSWPAQRSGEDETAAIGELGEAIAAVDVFADIPVLMAKALAGGISLGGAGEALSIGAAGLFLRSLGGNPMDVHLHTSVNLRRYLLRQDGISLKNKLMLLLTRQSGPEIRSTAGRMEPYPQPDMEAVAALPARSQEELLNAIRHSIYTQPPTDWSKVTNLGVMRAVPEVKETVNLATQYMKAGYDPQAFIAHPNVLIRAHGAALPRAMRQKGQSGGGKHLVSGGCRGEFVEGLADNRGRGAPPRRCLDLGIPRVICVIDPAIRIAGGHPHTRGPGVESIPVGTPQDWSDNNNHVNILQDLRPDRLQVERWPETNPQREGARPGPCCTSLTR